MQFNYFVTLAIAATTAVAQYNDLTTTIQGSTIVCSPVAVPTSGSTVLCYGVPVVSTVGPTYSTTTTYIPCADIASPTPVETSPVASNVEFCGDASQNKLSKKSMGYLAALAFAGSVFIV